MSLVPSLLQAIVHVDGEALVMHAGDKPYVVAPAGQIELASSPLALDAVSGIVAQLLPPEFQQALDEFGAVQYELPPQPDFPRERFTVVVARGGDDVWAEIRRRRVLEDGFFDQAMASAERNAGTEPIVDAVAASDTEAGVAQVESAASPARPTAGQDPLSPALIEKTAAAEARLDALTRRLTVLDERTRDLQDIEQRVQALAEAARLAEQAPPKAIDGDLRDAEAQDKNLIALAEKVDGLGKRFDALQESRQEPEALREAARQAEAVQHLSSEMRQTQATLETLQKARAEVDELRGRLRDADAKDKKFAALAEKVDGLGKRFDALQESRQEIEALREAARQTDPTIPNVIGPDELQKYRETVQHLSSEMRQTQTTLETLQKERAEVDELRGRLRDADAKDKNFVVLAEKVDGFGQRFDALQESRQEVLREAARQAEQITQRVIGGDGELQKHRQAVEHLSSEMRQMQAALETLGKERAAIEDLRGQQRDADVQDKHLVALVERVDVLGKRVDTVLVQVGEIAKQQSAIEPLAKETTRFNDAVAAPVASSDDTLDVSAISFEREPARKSPIDDDLVLPDLAQLWREEKANGVAHEPKPVSRPAADDDLALPDANQLWSTGARRDAIPRTQSPGATVKVTPPVRSVPPAPAVKPAPPAATIEAPPERPAPQPGVVLPMSRNPIRADREEAPAPAADDTLSDLERLLRTAASRGASTLYLASDARPSIRIDGEIQILDGEPVLTSHDVVSLLLTLMPERSHEALRTGATTEWICDIEAIGRVRCMSIRDHRGPGGVFRLMPGRAVSVDQLGLSAEIQALAVEPEGLVLVAGPRSSGKRTLISALVDLINRTRHDHMITIEREINIVHARGRSIVSQREVRGGNAEMLAAARAALREDPDVLVLEQIRTGELMNVALEAAASGHLVVGGFAAHDATETIDRVIDLYAPEHSRQVQFALADNLRGVVAQILLPKTGGGRVAARELLLNTPAVSSVLAEGTTSQLPMAIEGGRRHGMVPLTDALVPLVKSGAVETLEACRHVTDRPAFLALLKRHGIDTSLVERRA